MEEGVDRYAKAFVKASLVYLGIGAMLGVVMVLWPDVRFTLARVHTHITLLGFMAMMVYGVGYHILPRFMGRPLYSNKLGEVQFWLANISLVAMLLFYCLDVFIPGGPYRTLAVVSGAVQALTIFLFFYNMLMTLLAKQEQAH